MPNRSFRIIMTAILALFIVGCTNPTSRTKPNEVPDKSPKELYEVARKALENSNFQTAATNLEALSSRYPYGPYTEQVQLDLIFTYYKLQDWAKALAATDRFIRQHPEHPRLDYAYYMRGLINFSSDSNMLQSVFRIDRASRDPEPARAAFEDFASLVRRFPDSRYAADSRKRMVFLKSRLAQHEIAIAQYYMTRQAYVAAANRADYVVKFFSDTPEVETALAIMAESYEQMGLTDLRDETLDVLQGNYPDNKVLRSLRR